MHEWITCFGVQKETFILDLTLLSVNLFFNKMHFKLKK